MAERTQYGPWNLGNSLRETSAVSSLKRPGFLLSALANARGGLLAYMKSPHLLPSESLPYGVNHFCIVVEER